MAGTYGFSPRVAHLPAWFWLHPEMLSSTQIECQRESGMEGYHVKSSLIGNGSGWCVYCSIDLPVDLLPPI
jgi:hypothetical protein